ncbi:DNA binding HTH domain, AraC-type [Spirosomataceae bacterium]|jgi:AraC-like DNA-binding protein
MFVYVPYLSFLTSGIGFLFIFFLIYRFGNISKVYWLIGLVLCIVWMEFYMYALTSKHIYQLLFLSRTANVFRAFIPVFLYFYIWTMLNPDKKIATVQLLHFIFPVTLTLVVAPDFFLPNSQKIALLDDYYKQNDILLIRPTGLIPAGIIQPLLINFGLIYGVYNAWLIQNTKKINGIDFFKRNKQILNWLNLLTISVTLFFVFQLFQYFSLSFNQTYNPLSQIFKCSMVIIFCNYLIITPNVHENMDGCIISQPSMTWNNFLSLEDINPKLLAAFQKDNLALKIEEICKTNKCYLDKSCDLTSMANLLEVSPGKLSSNVKLFYGISFVEFINRLRIHYFLSSAKDFDTFTFETCINNSGFKSRSTFYSSFKKYVGINPSAYLKVISK